jgi:hypothetical protein
MMLFETCVLGLHLLTRHFSPPEDGGQYRSLTPGVYVQCENGLVAGYVKNSFGHPSEYIGREWKLGAGFSADIGVAHGYRVAPMIPVAALNYQVGKLRWTLLPDKKLKPLALSVGFQF